MKITAKYRKDSRTLTLYFPKEFDDSNIADGSITTELLADDAVTSDKVADDAIQSFHIDSNVIQSDHLQDAIVTAAKVASEAITNEKLADLAVTAAKLLVAPTQDLAPNPDFEIDSDGDNVPDEWDWVPYETDSAISIDTSTHQSGSQSVKIGNATAANRGGYLRTTSYIPVSENKTYTLSCWAKGDVTTTTAYIGVICCDASKSVLGYVYCALSGTSPGTSWTEHSGTIGANGDQAFPSGTKYVRIILIGKYNTDAAGYIWFDNVRFQETITGVYVGEAAIGAAAIADLAVGSAKIANEAVIESKIASAAISEAKIQDLAVSSGKIANLAVTNAKIANGAITEAKIDDLAVTEAKIANAAITTAKIEDAAITTAKIDDAAITNAKIGTAAVESANIKDANITTAKIVDAAVERLKVKDGDISKLEVSYGSPEITVSSGGGTTIISDSITTYTNKHVAIFIGFELKQLISGMNNHTIEIFRGSTSIRTINLDSDAYYNHKVFLVHDTPGSGTFTYYIKGDAAGNGFYARKRILVLLSTFR